MTGMASDDETGRARSYRKAADRREQVLAKAIELFAEHGVEASLRSIGDAIGVSHAALRYYFPSRDDLLIAVYRAHEAGQDVTGATRVVYVSPLKALAVDIAQNLERPLAEIARLLGA